MTNVNVENAGQMVDLPMHAVVETNARLCPDGVQPILAGSAPPGVRSLLARHVANQEMIVEAALSRDRIWRSRQCMPNRPTAAQLTSPGICSTKCSMRAAHSCRGFGERRSAWLERLKREKDRDGTSSHLLRTTAPGVVSPHGGFRHNAWRPFRWHYEHGLMLKAIRAGLGQRPGDAKYASFLHDSVAPFVDAAGSFAHIRRKNTTWIKSIRVGSSLHSIE